MRGVIGLLTGKGPACDELQAWLDRELGPTPFSRALDVWVNRKSGNQIAYQRNRIVRELEPDDQFVLYIDNDNVPPPGALLQLWNASAISGVAGAVILERTLPFNVCAVKSLEPYARYTVEDLAGLKDPFPVIACGTGCMMIRRDVLRDLGDPWFRCGQIHPELISEDLDFCLRAAEVGHPPYLVPTVKAGHRTDCIIWPGDDGQPWAQWLDASGGRAPYRIPLPLSHEREIHER